MWKVYLIMFIIILIISCAWVYLIDQNVKYKKENPDHNDNDGWLDWDQDKNNK
jgi:hypothetical protein